MTHSQDAAGIPSCAAGQDQTLIGTLGQAQPAWLQAHHMSMLSQYSTQQTWQHNKQFVHGSQGQLFITQLEVIDDLVTSHSRPQSAGHRQTHHTPNCNTS